MWDRKKATQAILQRKRSGGEIVSGPTPMMPEKVSHEDGSPDLKHFVAQDIMDAFHSKSADALREHLDKYIDLHMNKGSEDKPEPQE